MDNQDKVIKHLEMIQGVINRLGSNSFMLKGWSMTIIAAVIILIARYDSKNCIILVLIIPTLGFWILDGYFLWQEKLFRQVYDKIRKQDETDFAMDFIENKKKLKINWCCCIFSKTLNIFYMIQIFFIIATFCLK